MVTSGLVDTLPFWVIALFAIIVVLLSIELGWRLGLFATKKLKLKSGFSFSIAVGSTLGLLSFLLAVTFSMSLSRYDLRKANVTSEANAIGTTYLRTDFLPEPLREEAQQQLRDYTSLRVGGEASILSDDGMARSGLLQNSLWKIATSAVKQSDTISTGLFVQSLNEMIDMDTTRVAGLRNKLPDDIWFMLVLVTVFSMASLGFEYGIQGKRSWIGNILLVIAFTAVILLIADLDRPQQGLVQISQQPLMDLLSHMSVQ
jgi:hypothetical protein